MAGNNELKHSTVDALRWANYIIENDTTLNATSKHFDIPPTTLWRYIKNLTSKEVFLQVSEVLEKHKKDSPHKAISKKWENYYSSQSD